MYRYADLKQQLFTDDGQRMFLKARDRVHELLALGTGAFVIWEVMRVLSGDDWLKLACVDRLVELEEIREVTDPKLVAGQDRVFVRRS
jgi:hypothetical protein